MMIHPSYKEMIAAVNSEIEDGTVPVVSSRYSIVMATAKRARQIIDGDEPLIENEEEKKPLSIREGQWLKQQLPFYSSSRNTRDVSL